MQEIKKRLLCEKGFASIYTLIVLAFLLPFLLFTVIDINHFMQQNSHLKSVLDNASASAVTKINNDKLADGIIEINSDEAEEAVLRVLKASLLLNDDLTPKSNSILSEKPEIKIYVVNDAEGGKDITTPLGVTNTSRTSVIVYGKFSVKALFINKLALTMEKEGMSQALFK